MITPVKVDLVALFKKLGLDAFRLLHLMPEHDTAFGYFALNLARRLEAFDDVEDGVDEVLRYQRLTKGPCAFWEFHFDTAFHLYRKYSDSAYFARLERSKLKALDIDVLAVIKEEFLRVVSALEVGANPYPDATPKDADDLRRLRAGK